MTGNTNKTIYYDEQGQPRLLPSYCVFLDFLGFSQEVKAAANSGNEQAVFQKFMSEVEPEIERLIEPLEWDIEPVYPRTWDAKVFTDNVVLGYALRSDDGETEFGSAIYNLIQFQLAVALKGYFVRGGWTIGNLFMNPNTVYGEPLIDAYELENRVANYPRIVLSDDMKSIVYRHMAYYVGDAPQCSHLIIDHAGMLSTNYLAGLIDDEIGISWTSLEKHGGIIQKRLEEHKSNRRVLEKYRWLAEYHNSFCEFASLEFEDASKYRIKLDSQYGLRALKLSDSPDFIAADAKTVELEGLLNKQDDFDGQGVE